jgi:glycogen synthase
VRVLAVGNMYPPHHFGGYELVWQAAMTHLRERGHEVEILTTDLRTGDREEEDPDVHRDLRWAWRPGGFATQRLRERVAMARHNHTVLERRLAAFGPDVVSWWSMGGLTLSTIEAIRRRGLPAVGFVHDDWLDYGRHVDGWLHLFGGRKRVAAPLAERLAGIPVRVNFGAAARWVFVSESSRRRVDALGLGLRDTAVAHSGIEARFLEAAPEHDWDWRLLYVGRLDERKGIHTAIDALGRLPQQATLTVAGGWDDAQERRLRDLAARLGVADRVRFEGQVERDRLPALYAAADAVVFPVVWEEPWGLVPLEAMGVGRPVVATGRGGSAEYLADGENALLFPAGDAAALAATVERLAGDPALRDRLRARGRDTAARHPERHFNEAVERHLLEVRR